jgi:hypothetical protein
MTGPQILLAKALAPDLELTRIGEVKLGCNLLLTKSLHQPDQQLMTEAPLRLDYQQLMTEAPRGSTTA